MEREQIEDLMEKHRAEKSQSAERIRKLSRLTNRRRKAHELKRQVVQIKEAQYQKEVLAQRKQKLLEITQRFQKQPISHFYKASDELDYLTKKFSNDQSVLDEALKAVGSKLNYKKQLPVAENPTEASKQKLEDKNFEKNCPNKRKSAVFDFQNEYQQKLMEKQQKIVKEQEALLQEFITSLKGECKTLHSKGNISDEIKSKKSQLEREKKLDKLIDYRNKLKDLKVKMYELKENQEQHNLEPAMQDTGDDRSNSGMSVDSLEEPILSSKSVSLNSLNKKADIKHKTNKFSSPNHLSSKISSMCLKSEPCTNDHNSTSDKNKTIKAFQNLIIDTSAKENAVEKLSSMIHCTPFQNSPDNNAGQLSKDFNKSNPQSQKNNVDTIRGILKTAPSTQEALNEIKRNSNNSKSSENQDIKFSEEINNHRKFHKKPAVRFVLNDQRVSDKYRVGDSDEKQTENCEYNSHIDSQAENHSSQVFLQPNKNINRPKVKFMNTIIKSPTTAKGVSHVNFPSLIISPKSDEEEECCDEPKISRHTSSEYHSEITVIHTTDPPSSKVSKNYHCKDVKVKYSTNQTTVKNETLIQNKKQESSNKFFKKVSRQNSSKHEIIETKEIHSPSYEDVTQFWDNLCTCLNDKSSLNENKQTISTKPTNRKNLTLKIRPSSAYKKNIINHSMRGSKNNSDPQQKFTTSPSKSCNCLHNRSNLNFNPIPPKCKSPTPNLDIHESSYPRAKALLERRYEDSYQQEGTFQMSSRRQEDNKLTLSEDEAKIMKSLDRLDKQLKVTEANYRILKQEAEKRRNFFCHQLRPLKIL